MLAMGFVSVFRSAFSTSALANVVYVSAVSAGGWLRKQSWVRAAVTGRRKTGFAFCLPGSPVRLVSDYSELVFTSGSGLSCTSASRRRIVVVVEFVKV